MGKRMISLLLIVGICLSVTACSPVENLFDIMDPETGEVIEQNQNIDSNKVVDLRKAF